MVEVNEKRMDRQEMSMRSGVLGYPCKNKYGKILFSKMSCQVLSEDKVERGSSRDNMQMWATFPSLSLSFEIKNNLLFLSLCTDVRGSQNRIQDYSGFISQTRRQKSNVWEVALKENKGEKKREYEKDFRYQGQSKQVAQANDKKYIGIQAQGNNQRQVSTRGVGRIENKVSFYLPILFESRTRNQIDSRPYYPFIERWHKYNRKYPTSLSFV